MGSNGKQRAAGEGKRHVVVIGLREAGLGNEPDGWCFWGRKWLLQRRIREERRWR